MNELCFPGFPSECFSGDIGEGERNTVLMGWGRAKGTSFKHVTMFSKVGSPLPCHSAGKASLTGVVRGHWPSPHHRQSESFGFS